MINLEPQFERDGEAFELIKERFTVPWLPLAHEASLIKSEILPPSELVTSVHGLLLRGDEILFVDNDSRGLEIPGGHVDPGEDLETALRRECLEEASVTLEAVMPFASLKLHKFEKQEEREKYPFPVSYLCFFVAQIETLEKFDNSFETSSRVFIPLEEVMEVPWAQRNEELIRALQRLVADEIK